MKFQSIILPNGMSFHVFGPISSRRHDLYLFRLSNINSKSVEIQRDYDERLRFRVYGDKRDTPMLP